MKLGIVGLPNVGKSTLFNAITKAGAECANYPFCTIEPNVGVVAVPDKRLDFLENLYKSKRKVYATVDFVDIAGLVKGASKGEGLGNQFLSHIRETAAIVHVVRCFENGDIAHVEGKIDPLRDIEIIETELLLSDLETMTKKIDKLQKDSKSKDKKIIAEKELAEKVKKHLDDGKAIRTLELNEEETEMVKNFFLITAKPVIYACNVAETDLPLMKNKFTDIVEKRASEEGAQAIPICAKIEAELSELSDSDRQTFLSDLGLTEPGLNRLIKASYNLLGLITYLTAGEDECRAWTIKKGFLAPQAAGVIHTDFEKGFIRAEVMTFDDIFRLGNDKAVKESGHLRSEGRDYEVKDGDIIEFKFNVSK